MKKKRNKFVTLILVICCVISVYGLCNYIFREKGTLYSLKMSKYYKDNNFDVINLDKGKPVGKINFERYGECEEVSRKILDYINKFELTEISSRNGKKKDSGDYIIFLQINEVVKRHLQSEVFLRINFLSDSTLEIISRHRNFRNSKTDTIDKYYKINKGKIDVNYIYKLLN